MTRRASQCKSCRIKTQGTGENHPAWKGGKHLDSSGYVLIYCPEDPRANMGRYLLEHKIVMERYLGRELLKNESVHHKNGNRTDNRIENLELWSKSQPAGQRIEDKLAYAYEIIALYGNLTDAQKSDTIRTMTEEEVIDLIKHYGSDQPLIPGASS